MIRSPPNRHTAVAAAAAAAAMLCRCRRSQVFYSSLAALCPCHSLADLTVTQIPTTPVTPVTAAASPPVGVALQVASGRRSKREVTTTQ